jgi:hypothetical protein
LKFPQTLIYRLLKDFMKGCILMISLKKLLATVAAIAIALEANSALAITSVKKVNLLHNNTNSFLFAATADNLNTFGSASDGGGTFTPVGAPRAGEVTSLTTHGVFTIVGNSTSEGGWNDNNGVPAGITLTFNADITFSVGPGSPAGSYLTLTQNGANRGDGLGITQFFHGTHTLDSFNLNEIPNTFPFDPNDLSETLAVSAVTVSDVNFSGALTETGFLFTPGAVGNFGPYVLRSSGFREDGETTGLLSANNAVDPDGLGRPTIGFGVPSSDPSEVGRGEGFVASNVSIENGFANSIVTTNGVDHGTYFPRQPGAFTLTMQNGTMGFKGIGYEYDVTFDIAAIPPSVPGDYNKNGVVDAADYVLWRKGDLAADGTGDTIVDQADYDFWRARFENTSGAGAGSGLSGAAVPEPTGLAILIMGLIGGCVCRRMNQT